MQQSSTAVLSLIQLQVVPTTPLSAHETVSHENRTQQSALSYFVNSTVKALWGVQEQHDYTPMINVIRFDS